MTTKCNLCGVEFATGRSHNSAPGLRLGHGKCCDVCKPVIPARLVAIPEDAALPPKQGTKRRRKRQCGHCGDFGHIRTSCPTLEPLNKYQRRGIKYYYSKQDVLKSFNCASGTRCLDNRDLDGCWSHAKCPECLEVRLMGYQLKMTMIRNQYNTMSDYCVICKLDGHISATCPEMASSCY